MKLHIHDSVMSERMVIHVTGAVTLSDSDDLELALLLTETAGARDVTMDLARVTHVDSVGLGTIVSAHDRVTAGGASFHLANTPASVRLAIQQTGLDRILSTSAPVEVPRQVAGGHERRVPKQRCR